jgi:hypothetical protein
MQCDYIIITKQKGRQESWGGINFLGKESEKWRHGMRPIIMPCLYHLSGGLVYFSLPSAAFQLMFLKKAPM